MDNESFRFQIGNFECMAISDGKLTSKTIAGQLDVTCLLVKTGEHTVLIDSGFGVGERPNVGKLLENLQISGIRPVEVDTIIHSHLHVDHIGGNVDAEGRAIFPNARYLVHREEWEFWKSKLGQMPVEAGLIQSTITAIQKNIMPVQNKLKLIDVETEILPGIRFTKAPGHTPGNMVLEISSGTERLLFIGDLLHSPIEFAQPALFKTADVAHEQAVTTRHRILSQVATDGTMVFACHFPFPGLGHILQKGDIFQWQPIGRGSQ